MNEIDGGNGMDGSESDGRVGSVIPGSESEREAERDGNVGKVKDIEGGKGIDGKPGIGCSISRSNKVALLVNAFAFARIDAISPPHTMFDLCLTNSALNETAGTRL